MNNPGSLDLTRRQFIAGTTALSVSLLGSQLARAEDVGPKINIGLIGSGKRGTWIANLFQKDGGYNIAATADYFEDRATAAGDKLGVPAGKRFSGLNGYRRLLEEKLDAVVIESPPYFHPEQAAAAVEAGKHVYVAKPIAVDVPGCQTIAQSAKKATDKNLVFLVDFQTRATLEYQEVIKRVHRGDIGPIKAAEAGYQCSLMFADVDAEFRKSARTPNDRLRAWFTDRVLSGDVITEQNIHALDVATWFLDAAPIKAIGVGHRVRDFVGDCWDQFSVIYSFPNDVTVTFCSKQFGTYDDIMCRVYGLTGTADTHYGGKVWVRGQEEAYSGETPRIYHDGTVKNIATFRESIRKGDFANPTVTPSVRSTLTTILGRMASYKKQEVTWSEMMKANEKWEFDTKGLKA